MSGFARFLWTAVLAVALVSLGVSLAVVIGPEDLTSALRVGGDDSGAPAPDALLDSPTAATGDNPQAQAAEDATLSGRLADLAANPPGWLAVGLVAALTFGGVAMLALLSRQSPAPAPQPYVPGALSRWRSLPSTPADALEVPQREAPSGPRSALTSAPPEAPPRMRPPQPPVRPAAPDAPAPLPVGGPPARAPDLAPDGPSTLSAAGRGLRSGWGRLSAAFGRLEIGTVTRSWGSAVGRAARVTGRATQRAALATGRATQRVAVATGRATQRAARAVWAFVVACGRAVLAAARRSGKAVGGVAGRVAGAWTGAVEAGRGRMAAAREARANRRSAAALASRRDRPEQDLAEVAEAIRQEVPGDDADLRQALRWLEAVRRRLAADIRAAGLDARLAVITLTPLPVAVGLSRFVVDPNALARIQIGVAEGAALVAAAGLTIVGCVWLRRIARPPFRARPSRWREQEARDAGDAEVRDGLERAFLYAAAGLELEAALERAAPAGHAAHRVLEDLRSVQQEGRGSVAVVVRERQVPLWAQTVLAGWAEDAQAADVLATATQQLHWSRAQRAEAQSRTVALSIVAPFLLCIVPATLLVSFVVWG